MLPYASYGGSPYGRRKGILSSQNNVIGILAIVAIAALGFSVFTHFRASSANAQKAAIRNELESLRSELHSIRSQFSSRNAELEQLQSTYGHTQRRITELTSQLQRKEADLVSKEQALQQHVKERGVMDQHRSGREAELSKMVEDLRAELIRSDGVIEALDSKVAAMESTHSTREKDWHALANKWIKYEQDLHDQYKNRVDSRRLATVSQLLTATRRRPGWTPADAALWPSSSGSGIIPVPVGSRGQQPPVMKDTPGRANHLKGKAGAVAKEELSSGPARRRHDQRRRGRRQRLLHRHSNSHQKRRRKPAMEGGGGSGSWYRCCPHKHCTSMYGARRTTGSIVMRVGADKWPPAGGLDLSFEWIPHESGIRGFVYSGLHDVVSFEQGVYGVYGRGVVKREGRYSSSRSGVRGPSGDKRVLGVEWLMRGVLPFLMAAIWRTGFGGLAKSDVV